MTRHLKRRSATWPSRNVIALVLLIAVGDVVPPALPAGWLATNALGPPPLWVTSNSGVPTPPADTPPNAAFIDDPAVLSDKQLLSPNMDSICDAGRGAG